MSEQAILTDRQRQVLYLMAHGLTEQQIADQLGIAYETVRTHKQAIYDRLNVRETAVPRAAAVGAGFERGILV